MDNMGVTCVHALATKKISGGLPLYRVLSCQHPLGKPSIQHVSHVCSCRGTSVCSLQHRRYKKARQARNWSICGVMSSARLRKWAVSCDIGVCVPAAGLGHRECCGSYGMAKIARLC